MPPNISYVLYFDKIPLKKSMIKQEKAFWKCAILLQKSTESIMDTWKYLEIGFQLAWANLSNSFKDLSFGGLLQESRWSVQRDSEPPSEHTW